jgi:hypothetical protein
MDSTAIANVGLEYCLDCMTCSVCDLKDPKQEGEIAGMQPLCKFHFDSYKSILQVIDIREWPDELVNARLKHLYKLKDRDMKLLAHVEQRLGKAEVGADTIALVARDLRGEHYLKLSGINSRDKIAIVLREIKADLQDCARQISQAETLKQDSNVVSETSDSTYSGTQDFREKPKESEEQLLQKARRIGEALDPNLNKIIDAKEFLSRKIIRLSEPYLIVCDSSDATFQSLAAAINILARKHNYRIISTECDNRTMYVFMEKWKACDEHKLSVGLKL